MSNGRVHAQWPSWVFSLPGAAGHIKQGTPLPAHILSKMPGRDIFISQGVAMPGVPSLSGLQDRGVATQCFTHANSRGHEKCQWYTTEAKFSRAVHTHKSQVSNKYSYCSRRKFYYILCLWALKFASIQLCSLQRRSDSDPVLGAGGAIPEIKNALRRRTVEENISKICSYVLRDSTLCHKNGKRRRGKQIQNLVLHILWMAPINECKEVCH